MPTHTWTLIDQDVAARSKIQQLNILHFQELIPHFTIVKS